MEALPREFFERNTVTVAKELLGKHLLVWDEPSHDYISCKVVETEAYTQDDPACHAFKGAKGRAVTLFKNPGLAYVYFIYGMYHCLNVVTEPPGSAGAVLFRALEVVHNPTGRKLDTSGPGKLCRDLNIRRETHNERCLTEDGSILYLAEGEPVKEVVTTTRIGISSAEDYPWRFYIKDNPSVSTATKRKR